MTRIPTLSEQIGMAHEDAAQLKELNALHDHYEGLLRAKDEKIRRLVTVCENLLVASDRCMRRAYRRGNVSERVAEMLRRAEAQAQAAIKEATS